MCLQGEMFVCPGRGSLPPSLSSLSLSSLSLSLCLSHSLSRTVSIVAFKCGLSFQTTHIIYRMWIHVCRNSSCSAKGSVHEICLRSQPTLTVQSDVRAGTVLLRACISFTAALLTQRPALNVLFCLFDFVSLFFPSSFPADPDVWDFFLLTAAPLSADLS